MKKNILTIFFVLWIIFVLFFFFYNFSIGQESTGTNAIENNNEEQMEATLDSNPEDIPNLEPLESNGDELAPETVEGENQGEDVGVPAEFVDENPQESAQLNLPDLSGDDIQEEEQLPENLLLKYFKQGGNFMWPLLICSIIALGIIIERIIRLLPLKVEADAFINKLLDLYENKGKEKAMEYCDSKEVKKWSILSRIAKSGLRVSDRGINSMEKAFENSATIEISNLEKGLPALQALANIAPLLGFLGTVVGMIISFEDISRANDMGPDVVSRGIYQALITTATGLMIAIPIFAAHNYFVSRIDKFTLLVEKISVALLELREKNTIQSES